MVVSLTGPTSATMAGWEAVTPIAVRVTDAAGNPISQAAVSCALSFPWQVGATYRFETQFTPDGGGELIDAWITAVATGRRTYIGRLRQPGAPPQPSFTTFVEDFIRNAPNCVANLLRSYRAGAPQALLGATWTALPTAASIRIHRRRPAPT